MATQNAQSCSHKVPTVYTLWWHFIPKKRLSSQSRKVGKTMSPPFLCCFLSDFFSNLQVTRTGIQSRMSSNFGQIGPLPTELGPLSVWKISHRLIMEKWCLQASSFIFNRISVKLAGNQDRHNISDEFEFGPDRISHFGVTCPWGRIKFSMYFNVMESPSSVDLSNENILGTLWAQLLLQFSTDCFETFQIFFAWYEDVHVVWI